MVHGLIADANALAFDADRRCHLRGDWVDHLETQDIVRVRVRGQGSIHLEFPVVRCKRLGGEIPTRIQQGSVHRIPNKIVIPNPVARLPYAGTVRVREVQVVVGNVS